MAEKDTPKPKKEPKGFVDGSQLTSNIPAPIPTTTTVPPANIPVTKPKPAATPARTVGAELPTTVSLNQIEQEINKLEATISDISVAQPVGANRFSYGGSTYTKEQLSKLVIPYRNKLNALKKVYEPYGNASAELARAKEIAANPITESPTGMSQEDADKAVRVAQAKVDKEKQALSNVDVSTPMPTLKSTGGQSGMSESETLKAFAGLSKLPGITEPKKPGKPGTPIAIGTTRVVKGVTQTWDGSKWTSGKGTTAKAIDWESKFREMFPGETWMLDIDRTKYPDVFALFQKSITDEVYKTPEGIARFKAQLQGTTFVKELATTDMVRQVKAVVGDLGFDSAPLSSFLTKAMNMGWKDATLKAEVYKEAFRKDDSGAYVNPTAITRAKASNDYLSVAKIGKDYFNTVSDDTIQNVLTGGMAQEDVQRQQRELAKTKYGHLSNLIDQGLSLAEVSSSFKQQAAGLLERDPNSIDMSQADFEEAFNFGEEGKKRVMTTGEWEIKLRSDPRYNWDKTTNAKQEARALANSIASAFGRVI